MGKGRDERHVDLGIGERGAVEAALIEKDVGEEEEAEHLNFQN